VEEKDTHRLTGTIIFAAVVVYFTVRRVKRLDMFNLCSFIKIFAF